MVTLPELAGAAILLAVVGVVALASPLGRSRTAAAAREVASILLLAEAGAIAVFAAMIGIWYGPFGAWR